MEPSTALIPIESAFKFKKSDLEALKDSKDGYLSSTIVRVCKISNVQYYIRIYPNGNHDEDRGMAFAFLVVEIGNAKCVESDFKYSIESATFSKYVKHVFKTSEAYGKHICSTKQLFYEKNNFFVDDFLVLKVKIIFKILLPSGIKYPLSAKWNIKESELEALKTSTNGCLKSKRFSISSDSDIKYFLTIYPNGNKKENRGAAWIFLHLNFECETSVNAVFSFFIKSANFSVDCQNLYSKSGGWGSFICLTKDLFNLENGYFIDGELCLEISGTLILQKEYSQNTVLKCEKAIETKTCRKYRAKNFTVIVEEKEIEVHEHVLEEASPVFSAMLNSGMKEKLERKMYIPDFTYEIVKAAIQLMYSFSVDQKFTFEQMKQLLRFSDKYDIKLIKDLVQDYLIENLSPTNVCNLIYFTTNIVVASKLRAKCSEYLIKCLKESKSVHGLETLEKDFCHSIFLDAFSQNIVTENV